MLSDKFISDANKCDPSFSDMSDAETIEYIMSADDEHVYELLTHYVSKLVDARSSLLTMCMNTLTHLQPLSR